jgi:hypothetical protein
MRTAEVAGSARLALETPYRYFADVELRLPDIGLAREFESLLPVPVSLAGAASASGRLHGTLTPLDFRVVGGLYGRDLTVDSVRLDRVSLVYGTDGHRAAIRDLDVRAWGGEVTGSASVVPHEHMRVDLQFRDVQAGQFVDAFGGFPIDVSARTSGQLQAYVPSDRIQDISAWKANGELNLLELSAAGVAASAQGRWELANGLVQFSQATLQVAGTPVSFSGQVRATPPYAFTSAVEARDGDLQQWQRLTPLTGRFTALRGRFSTAANVRGQLQPLHVQGSGQFSARDVGIEHLHIDQLAFSYALDRQRVLGSTTARRAGMQSFH